MVDKKKKKTVRKKVKKVASNKNRQGEQQHTKVTTYQEMLSRKKKQTFVKESKRVHKGTTYIMLIGFVVVSFVTTRLIMGSLGGHQQVVVNDVTEDTCSDNYKFTAAEGELLKISEFINKPVVNGERIKPCDNSSNEKLALYSFEKREQAKPSFKELKEQLKIKGKINRLISTDEKPEVYSKRVKDLAEFMASFKKDYPRFKLKGEFPEGALYYGVEMEKMTETTEFLDKKQCLKPKLVFANNEISHLSLFFTLNAVRGFQGRVKMRNNRFKTLIQGKFGVYEYQRVPFNRYIPEGIFEMWSHKKMKVDFKGYNYQRQFASQKYRFDWDRTPWLYNECSQAISTISNYCSLDPRYDMQFKDIFYSIRRDMVLGNIYCKKSYEKKWHRIASFEFVRTN